MRNFLKITDISQRSRKLTFSALYLAIALVLPFLTGQIPEIGAMLCPMHIPVLLCGFACGWPWGLAVGVIAPLLRSVVIGMPPMLTAIAMAFELGAYGLISGLLYKKLPRKTGSVYAALILSMAAGRIVWGLARWLLAGLQNTIFTWELFVAGAITSAIPGIILHIILIPVLILALERAKLVLNHEEGEEIR